jgi:hypothetical protein
MGTPEELVIQSSLLRNQGISQGVVGTCIDSCLNVISIKANLLELETVPFGHFGKDLIATPFYLLVLDILW